MKIYGKNDESTVRQTQGQQKASSRKIRACHEPGPWKRPDRICGECVYGEPYVHPGGIYCVIKCHKGNGPVFRGHYERACWQYRLNTAVSAFMQSRMEERRKQESVSRSTGGSISSPSAHCDCRFEDEEAYLF